MIWCESLTQRANASRVSSRESKSRFGSSNLVNLHMQINFLNKMILSESLTQRLKGVEFQI